MISQTFIDVCSRLRDIVSKTRDGKLPRDYWKAQPHVIFILRDDHGNVMCVKQIRSDKLGPPKGAVDLDEKYGTIEGYLVDTKEFDFIPFACAKRELREELGASPSLVDSMNLQFRKELHKGNLYVNGEKFPRIIVILEGKFHQWMSQHIYPDMHEVSGYMMIDPKSLGQFKTNWATRYL